MPRGLRQSSDASERCPCRRRIVDDVDTACRPVISLTRATKSSVLVVDDVVVAVFSLASARSILSCDPAVPITVAPRCLAPTGRRSGRRRPLRHGRGSCLPGFHREGTSQEIFAVMPFSIMAAASSSERNAVRHACTRLFAPASGVRWNRRRSRMKHRRRGRRRLETCVTPSPTSVDHARAFIAGR
jgi:hypothetical protein